MGLINTPTEWCISTWGEARLSMKSLFTQTDPYSLGPQSLPGFHDDGEFKQGFSLRILDGFTIVSEGLQKIFQ
jgi:hypothetical protein